MDIIIKYLSESNRWKHLLGGAIIAIPFSIFSGLYTTIVVGLALEYKDKAHGGKFDLHDLLCTICGGALVTIFKFALGL